MLRASERSYSRRDTWAFAACVLVSMVLLFSPASWAAAIAGAMRGTVLLPIVWLEAQAQEARIARSRYREVAAERDSAALALQDLPALRTENARLRDLLDLGQRLGNGFRAAEVLHQSLPTDGRTLLVNVGRADGVAAFAPVVAPEGLVGAIWSVAEHSSVVMTWAHPEFRASAMTEDGRVFGLVAPADGEKGPALEFRAITYRDTITAGTRIVASGLGGVYPKGLPLGIVMAVGKERGGWERVYQLRPAAVPAAVAHVLILTEQRAAGVAQAYQPPPPPPPPPAAPAAPAAGDSAVNAGQPLVPPAPVPAPGTAPAVGTPSAGPGAAGPRVVPPAGGAPSSSAPPAASTPPRPAAPSAGTTAPATGGTTAPATTRPAPSPRPVTPPPSAAPTRADSTAAPRQAQDTTP